MKKTEDKNADRRLKLHRETLRRLVDADFNEIHGGKVAPTIRVTDCFSGCFC